MVHEGALWPSAMGHIGTMYNDLVLLVVLKIGTVM